MKVLATAVPKMNDILPPHNTSMDSLTSIFIFIVAVIAVLYLYLKFKSKD